MRDIVRSKAALMPAINQGGFNVVINGSEEAGGWQRAS